MKTMTFAEKLGMTPHDSPLMQKARQLGLNAGGLEQLAIQRGCDYYHDGGPLPVMAVGLDQFPNEELVVTMLSPSLSPTPRAIRLSAALLGIPGLDGKEIAKLSELEDCAGIVRYIARCGQRFEPENPFWNNLLKLLPEINVDPDQMPHPTRFVEMTGIDRGQVGLRSRWIRPRRRAA